MNQSKFQKKKSETLAPGQYEEIFVDEKGVLILEGGLYSVKSIEIKKKGQLLFADSTQLVVEEEFKSNKDTVVGPSSNSDITAADIEIFVGSNINPDSSTNVDFDKDVIVSANIYAPNGEIKMDKGAVATGSFVANKVKIEKDSSLALASPSTIPTEDLVNEYFDLIEKINDIGSEIEQTVVTQALIDEINDDLDHITQIVIELQMRGYDGDITATRNNSEMIGTVKFFDENTNDALFEIVISSNVLSMFYAFAFIEEFENGGFVHTFDEQTVIINSAPYVVSVITTFEDDEIAGELVLASIGMYHPSTGSTVKKFIDDIIKTATKTQRSVSQCLSDQDCKNDLFDILEEIAESLYESNSFQIVTIPLTKYNDVNGNGIFDSDETGLNNWAFALSVFTPDPGIGIPQEIPYALDTTNNDGDLTFSQYIPADATRLHVIEFLEPGWQFTSPIDGEHTLDYEHDVNTEYDRLFFGNQEIVLPPSENPTFGNVVNVSNDSTQSRSGDMAISGQNVYVTWTDSSETGSDPAFLNDVFFKKSNNNGASFSSPINLSNIVLDSHIVEVVPKIAASGNNVYVVWSESFYGSGPFPQHLVKITASNNNGDNFNSPIVIHSGDRAEIQNIIAYNNFVYVIWNTNEDIGEDIIRFTRSADSGLTFTPFNTVSAGPSHDLQYGDMTAQTNNVYVGYTASRSDLDISNVYFRTSHNSGETFSIPLKFDLDSIYSHGIKLAASGNNVYALWLEEDGLGDRALMLATSTDHGDTFDAPSRITDFGDIQSPDIGAIGNNVYVSFRDDGPTGIDVFFLRSSNNGQSFGSPENITNHVDGLEAGDVIQNISGDDVFLIWQLDGPGLFFSTSTEGRPFAEPLELSNGNIGGMPDLEADENNVYSLFEEFNVDDFDIFLSVGN